MSNRYFLLSVLILLAFGIIITQFSNIVEGPSVALASINPESSTVSQVSYDSGEGKIDVITRTLTLEEAYELALENNIDLKKAALDYDSAITDADQASYNADSINSEDVKSLQEAQTKYVSTKQKSLALNVARQAFEIAKEQTKITVEGKYYDVLKAENLVKVREITVKRAEEQLGLVQKKFKAGSAIKTDLNRAQMALDSAKIDLVNAQREYKNAQIALNSGIGLDLNSDIEPFEALNYERVEIPSVDQLTDEALEKRLDLQRAQNNVLVSQLSYDYIVGYQAPNTFSARNSKIALEKAKLDLIQQEQTVKADVISTVFQVQKADEVVQLQSKSLEQAKSNYSLATRRYEIGVGTYVDVLSSSEELASAEAKYIEAVYSYTLAKNQLNTVTLI